MAEQPCRHCGATIRQINYALGPEWMHVNPDASFPSTGKGTAWKTCRANTVAEPVVIPPEQRTYDGSDRPAKESA